jgi:hypothetical protein
MDSELKHVMVDLETLGTRPGDTILSIGAVKFSAEKGITEKFYVAIDSESCKEAGFRAQKSTLEWWSNQSEEARTAAFSGTLRIDLALIKFAMWMPPQDVAVVWGNGANFDNALLAAAYRLTKMDTPWHFWNDRCYRTIRAMFGTKERKQNVGVPHNALDDATTQALDLIERAAACKFELR